MNFLRRKTDATLTPEELTKELAKRQERVEILHDAVKSLLIFIKYFSFDLEEIQAAQFNKKIDTIIKVLDESDNARLQHSLQENKQATLDFIQREKNFFLNREKEFNDIITLLRSTLVEIIGSNQGFNTQMYESNVRLERGANLDDLRKVREIMLSEVSQAKRMIQQKQQKDDTYRASLEHKVTALQSGLGKAIETASTDSLTGALNRLAFDRQLEKLSEQFVVSRAPFSLLLCDLDDFKKINDTYGHQVGDRVLRSFVQECRQVFRTTDYIARYGGEEFVVLMPNTRVGIALKRGRQLCKTLAGKQYLIDEVSQQRVRFTVSIGVCEMRRNMTSEELVAGADKALYEAKHQGKNRAVFLS